MKVRFSRLHRCALLITCIALRDVGAQAVIRPPTVAGLLGIDSLWAANYAHNDTASARRLMSEDVVVTASDGRLKTRELELADIRPDPAFRMSYFRTMSVQPRLYGTAGVVTGIAEWAFANSGRTVSIRRRYTAVYAQGGEFGWELVGLHMGAPPSSQ